MWKIFKRTWLTLSMPKTAIAAAPALSPDTPLQPSFVRDLLVSLRNPEFWAYSSWLDIVTKFRRTRLGIIWAFIPVAIFVGLIGGFYSTIIGRDYEFFMPYLGVGYTVWRFMVQCTSSSATTLRQHKAFIMDGRTRLTDFVLREMAKNFFNFACAWVVVLPVLIWSPVTEWAGLLAALVAFPVIALNMAWWSTCMSLVGARHADVSEAVSATTRIGLLLTPIIWVGDRFPPDSIGWWAVQINPAYHLITLIRAPILGEPVSSITIAYLAGLTIGGWLLASILYRRYARFVPLWI